MREHIAVCVCTFRRSQLLANLLRTLSLQQTDGLFDVSVVVVDNDGSGPAEETVNTARGRLALDITYGVEAERSIAAARNHTLRLAKGNYIAFIDDDEFAPASWLLTMYQAIRTFAVDGVLGPVIPYFETNPPRWLVKSGLCERPVLRTGTLLHWNDTRTGNVLLRKDVFDRNSLLFDLKYRTSGSDKEFFREAMDRHCRFVAVAEAPVYEIVPPERQTKGYYIRRSILHASNERKYRAPLLRGVWKILAPARTALALGFNVILFLLRAPFGAHYVVKDGAQVAYHLSWLLTMFGFDLAKRRNV